MRLSSKLLVFLAYGLSVGCNAESAPKDAAPALQAAPPREATADGPSLALGYAAGDAPLERKIAMQQAALRQNPEDLQAHVGLATSFLRRARETSSGVYREYARDVIDAGRRQHPDAPGLGLLAAMLLLDDHKFRAAIDAAGPLRPRIPRDPTPHLLIGDASLELGDYDAAESAYEAAMNLRPDLRSYNRVGYMRWLYGDFEGAVAALELALDAGSARDPESQAWCLTDLGAMHLRRGAPKAAGRAATSALALVPGYAPALSLHARAKADAGDLDAAVTLAAQAAKRSPSTEQLLRLAELHERAGTSAKAAQALADAEKLAAHDPRPMAHYWARRGERPSEALALAKQEMAARENVWSLDTLALALVRAGDATAARDAMKRVRALGIVDAEVSLHEALIELEAGDSDAARSLLDAAVALNRHVDPLLRAELSSRLAAS